MYLEKCNRHAINVLSLTMQKSTELDTPELPGTGHLLLALMAYRLGEASRILTGQGLDYSKISQVEAKVRELSPPGEPTDPHVFRRIAELDEVLRVSATVAEVVHCREIDTEHILFAMFCTIRPQGDLIALVIVPEIDRIGARIMRDFQVRPKAIQSEVWKLDPLRLLN